ncbi:hypothetical protein ACQPW1_10475 [Nocardia sp. CA-128927]|uniref:hypothetical protein n=1 Tax=Nocardia sp. CA-128927 TaxID=3239975 RepID=UPI003D979EC3
MNVTVPDDFPDGPQYANLAPGEQYSLMRGWLYCARYDTFVVPSSIWFAFTSGSTHTLLERFGLIEISTAPAGVMLPGGGPAKRPRRTASTKPVEDNGFDEWWSVWPRKQAKQAARPAFAKALTKIGFDELVAATRRYAEDPLREDLYTPHPARWLNGERWADAPQPTDRRSLDASTRVNATVELGRRLAAKADQPMRELL